MIYDLKELSEHMTSLTDNFVTMAIAKERSGQSPAYISVLEALPEGFPSYLAERLPNIIHGELMARPELRNARLLTFQEAVEMRSPSRVMFALECEPEYVMGRQPEKHLSLARMAELGAKAIEYVREESEDFVQDMTERLGLSLEEVSILEPSYQYMETPLKYSKPGCELLADKIHNAQTRTGMTVSEGLNHSDPVFE